MRRQEFQAVARIGQGRQAGTRESQRRGASDVSGAEEGGRTVAEVRKGRTGSRYQVGETGRLDEVDDKLFIGQPLGFTGMEVSLNRVPPGWSMPFLHDHREHEELYLFLGGEGEFQVDGDIFPVSAGTAVRVSPGGIRAWRNTGTGDLLCVIVQANADSLAGRVAPEDASGFLALSPASVQDGIRGSRDVRWT